MKITRRHFLCQLGLLAPGLALPKASFATPYDLLEIIKSAEDFYSVPRDLGLAVALVESGRRRLDGHWQPWPWAVNIAGTSHCPKSSEQALSQIDKGLMTTNMIDVGVMQINIRWHRKNFSSVKEMIEPSRNIDYGMRPLRENRNRQDSWTGAVASYNSSKPKPRKRYICRVFETYSKLLKLRDSSFADPAGYCRLKADQ